MKALEGPTTFPSRKELHVKLINKYKKDTVFDGNLNLFTTTRNLNQSIYYYHNHYNNNQYNDYNSNNSYYYYYYYYLLFLFIFI